VDLKTPAQIEAMRAAGAVVARALAAAARVAAVGVTLRELDEAARSVIEEAGATSPFLGYRPSFASVPFPAVLCTSVNDAVLHGVPTDAALADGDLLCLDCGATLDGWTADAAITIPVGSPRAADLRLVDTAEQALAAGISAARAGGQLGDISAAIGRIGRVGGYGINTDFGGHGIGRTMHESPSIPNEGRSHRGPVLRTGMTFAIEPWFLAGGRDAYSVDPDGWTLRSADGSRGAHVEHTIAITPDGPEVLTARV
jgi:methionyl aminopeptidase